MSTTTSAPLQPYRATATYTHRTPDGQAAGTCWHCGQGIAIVVAAEHVETGERITVGTTCAERIGLDPEGIKRLNAERFATERYERSAARRREAAAESARLDVEVGLHGTPERFLSGCSCAPCCEAAPHGHPTRTNTCRCVLCLDTLLAAEDGRWSIADRRALIDLETGDVVADARLVSGRYGLVWRSDALDVWVNPAKRRATMARKGFTEADVPTLVERCGSGARTWFRPDVAVGSPIVDRWGEAIPRP